MVKILLILVVVLLIWKRGDLCSAIAKLLYARGKTVSWKKWYDIAAKLGGMSFNNKLTNAYLLLKDGDIDKANKLFALLSMERLTAPQKFQLKGAYALVFWKRGEVDAAIEMLEEVVQNTPTTSVYGSLGYMYIYNGNLSKALEFNLEAYEYNDTNAIIIDNLAYTYYKCGEFEKSKEFYEKLLEMNPTFPEAYYGYACLLAETGNAEKGIEMAQKALNSEFSFLTMINKQEISEFLADLQNTPSNE
ncbi:MAG: tetratricopeptide repeat protein [Firmicutes bacterium]|nr:tetratricopeptide repeat protein [Bacillota bacterium]